MSASLIGWLAKGPMNLNVSDSHQKQIVTQLAQIADWWLELGQDADIDYAARISECPISIAQSLVEDEESFFRLIDWLIDPVPNEATPLERIALRLDELLEWPPQNASVAWTQDPDDPNQVIVFAGEMSWGDLPDTSGYLQLQMLALTGVGAVVGIKLIDPCVTLTLTD